MKNMNENLFLNLIMASKKAKREWNNAVKNDGAEDTINSYFLLKACYPNGCDRKDLPLQTGIDNAYIAKNIQTIFNDDLVEKSSGHRKNAYRLTLTPHGVDVLEWLDRIYDQAESNFAENLSDKDVNDFMSTLNSLLKK